MKASDSRDGLKSHLNISVQPPVVLLQPRFQRPLIFETRLRDTLKTSKSHQQNNALEATWGISTIRPANSPADTERICRVLEFARP